MKHTKLAIICITVSLTSVTAFGQPSSLPAAARPSVRVVPIYLSGTRAIAVLRIGDHPPAPVVFDTGTSGNDIDSDYAAALKLEFDPTADVEVGDETGRTFVAKEAKVPVATLGEVPLTEKTATVFPYKARDVVGIFGPNSFAGRQVLLDLGHGRLIVRDRGANSPCRESTPYSTNGLPAVVAQLPGLSLPVEVDSGSQNLLVLPKSLAGKLPLRGSLRFATKGGRLSGAVDVYEGKVAGEVRIGHVVLRDPTVKFIEGNTRHIGLPIIGQLLIMLDPERKQACIVDPPSLRPAQLTGYAGRYGTRMIRANGGTLIYQLDGRRPFVLHPLAQDLFAIEETGDVVQFWRNKGHVVRMDVINNIGVSTSADRSVVAATAR